MNIIHFSDTHLGFSDLDITNDDGVNQREADFYEAFKDVIDAIIESKPDYVIHTGDLFHRASPSNRAITFALTQLNRLEKLGIPLIIIAGNHSTPRTTTSSPILQALSTLDNVEAVFEQRYETIEFNDVIFHALPHINDERIMPDQLDAIDANIKVDKKNVLMMHCSVCAHYLMHEFGEWVYPKEIEELFAKMDYVALGHIHKHQAISPAGSHPPVVYPGSIERIDFGEARERKGFVLAEISKGHTEWEFIPLKTRRFLDIPVETTDAGSFMQDILSQLPAPDDLDGAICRLKLTYPGDWEPLLDEKPIVEHFKQAFSLQIQKNRHNERRARLGDTASVESLTPLELLETYWLGRGLENDEIGIMKSLAQEILSNPEE